MCPNLDKDSLPVVCVKRFCDAIDATKDGGGETFENYRLGHNFRVRVRAAAINYESIRVHAK